jgi:hypothetical protein
VILHLLRLAGQVIATATFAILLFAVFTLMAIAAAAQRRQRP